MDRDAIAEGVLCKDCGEAFVVTRGEVSFYMKRGLVPPKRCPDCRRARKQRAIAVQASGKDDQR